MTVEVKEQDRGICLSCGLERDLVDGFLCEECFMDAADEDAQEIDFDDF